MSKWFETVKIKYLDTKGRRIIAVSDIHANLPYLKGLLKKVSFCEDDILIINGDFLEKGERSLDTLRYIMKLSEDGSCHVLCGNCDGWSDAVDSDSVWTFKILDYMLYRRNGLIWDMLTQLGYEITKELDFKSAVPVLRESFKPEWDFIRSLPHIIETEEYSFVHGGYRPDVPLESQHGGECMKFDNFLGTDYKFDKWVVVGHWPVVLYHEDFVCADPIIDTERKIISIDGGCVLKDDGQLNGLILKDGRISFESYDEFPVRRVKSAQKHTGSSYYIRWGDNDVQVIKRGAEFSLCRHVRTGYEMEILTKYLYSDEEFCKCNDCTDYILELEAGDTVGVVEETSRGCFVKHKGMSGWYYGELE